MMLRPSLRDPIAAPTRPAFASRGLDKVTRPPRPIVTGLTREYVLVTRILTSSWAGGLVRNCI